MPKTIGLADAAINTAISRVCMSLQFDFGCYVRSWPCYRNGEVETVLALLDPRDRDNLLREFGRYLLERKVEFAGNE